MLLRRSSARTKEQFWAVDDVTFDAMEGESVGLVGANGHGKSTLLKLIAGVLVPDSGSVVVRGGVAPLIELTGGFEGELTARENVYLAGGLHGLSREQIAERFDEIIDFAEIGDFIDTPFRYFSSGMKVRLGFAVVTTLDEPIVLVDEVLAVGDKKFRQKCYLRLDEMLGAGRTLFMVSHGEADLKRFCTRGLYMRRGKLITDGPIDKAIDDYNAYQDA
jgi:ABC-2 type transport system ATP-binding protein